jgi:DNA-binding NarL/FixJ family response regulator
VVDTSPKTVIVCESRLWGESLAFTLGHKLGQSVVLTTPVELDSTTVTPGMILVDFCARPENGFNLIASIGARHRDSKIIAVGLLESASNVLRLAEVGAHGYVLPTSSIEDLVDVLRAVGRGEFKCSSQITFALFLRLQELSQRSTGCALATSGLTAREIEITRLLSQDLSNKEIANSLCLSVHTVKNHVHNILKKLGAGSRVAAKKRLASLPGLGTAIAS